MTAKVFIDGQAGTTGLQIKARLEAREDIELLHLGEDERKDTGRRRDRLNEADLAILCLPDDAAREAITLIENSQTRVIDSSTAHRIAEGWVYGFPEYETGQRDLIAGARRVSNPGCYALASVAILHPLIGAGIVPSEWPVAISAISGYSGGGKSLIAEYENDDPESSNSEAVGQIRESSNSEAVGQTKESSPGSPFFTYAHGLNHKHVPEIVYWGGLSHAPIFMPSVGRFSQGMIVKVPLPLWAMAGLVTAGDLHEVLVSHYKGQSCVTVAALDAGKDFPRLEPESMNGTNELRLYVFANDAGSQVVVMGVLDNLGKGASGQAVQNMNLMLGMPEQAGL